MNPNFELTASSFALASQAGQVFQLRATASHTFQGVPTPERFEQAQREYQTTLQAIRALERRLADLKLEMAEVKRNLEDRIKTTLADSQALTHPERLGAYEFTGALVAVNPAMPTGYAVLVDGQGDPILETARALTKAEIGEALRGLQESQQLTIDDGIELARSGSGKLTVETSGDSVDIPF
jgi:hypothetical protein